MQTSSESSRNNPFKFNDHRGDKFTLGKIGSNELRSPQGIKIFGGSNIFV